MYPRNAASPEPIAIGPVILIADGTVQTSGCTVRIKPIGVAEGDGAGTTAYSTDGIVLYTPTQAETNYTSFVLIAKKASCIPANITIVTTESATPGRVSLGNVLGTALSEGAAGRLAGGVVKFFNVASPTGTVNSFPDAPPFTTGGLAGDDDIQTLLTRLGTPGNFGSGASVAANLTDLETLTDGIETEQAVQSAALAVVDGNVDDIELLVAATAIRSALGLGSANLDTQLGDLPTNSELATALGTADDAVLAQVALVKAQTDQLQFDLSSGRLEADMHAIAGYEIGSGVTGDLSFIGSNWEEFWFNNEASSNARLERIEQIIEDTNELQTDWANGGRLDLILDARASQTSVDDLPTNAELATALGTADDAVLAAIANLDTDISTLQTSVSGLGTTQIVESYRADGAAPTRDQALCELLAHMGEVEISGTTKQLNKFDGTTAGPAFTLDDASTPVSITRSA